METEQNLSSPWISVPIDDWLPLLSKKSAVSALKNRPIYQQGERSSSVYILKSGRVRITSYQPSGSEKQIYIAERGCLFGENACIMEQPHSTSAVAIVDSYLYHIPFADLQKAMQKDWALSNRVLWLLCRKKNSLFQQVLGLSFSQASQRIAQALVNLSEEYGVVTPKGIRITIHFTHQDVANIVKASRVTVSNVFGIFAEQGVLSKENGYFVIRGIDRLKTYADTTLDEVRALS